MEFKSYKSSLDEITINEQIELEGINFTAQNLDNFLYLLFQQEDQSSGDINLFGITYSSKKYYELENKVQVQSQTWGQPQIANLDDIYASQYTGYIYDSDEICQRIYYDIVQVSIDEIKIVFEKDLELKASADPTTNSVQETYSQENCEKYLLIKNFGFQLGYSPQCMFESPNIFNNLLIKFSYLAEYEAGDFYLHISNIYLQNQGGQF
ncbi:hypothetical protein PPERSA_01907 [Pseudocohnilembus persalinus]|uniref:Uncharacterized protein n=1 Tax=Pseudocohnilembus persalinus TaxID=266149 RepID=A0A0V0R3E3_PSEPJ|nr:hypothetical protein PPERSA_01907 [Pseudocohnilembus persalinus]|eukprot:KRX09020.1 hypothetical protein PPERSA_01907 [Pseudocohnilembus persalinus]